MTDTMKTLKVVPFSGKKEDWNRWSKTFLAASTVRGYREVIKPLDPTVIADPQKNTQAYSDLMMSCEDEVSFGVIDESVSTDFPDGDARLAWKNLYKKYEPTTGAMKVELKMEFQQLSLDDVNDDPDEWITKLELIRRRLKVLGHEISDEDMILHILNNMPAEYENLVETNERALTRGTLKLDELREEIIAKYRRLQKTGKATNTSKSESDEAVALIMRNQFKGACNVCGRIGHKGADCFSLEKNKDKKEKWMKAMREKRNKNGNRNNRYRGHRNNRNHQGNNNNEANNERENAMAAVTTLNEDMILMAKEDEKGFKNTTWIADTGSSSHMTHSLKGMYDLRDYSSKISVGNGKAIEATKIGNWKGVFIDANGKKKKIVLEGVQYVPELMVNLFSLTKVMKNGFEVNGKNNYLSIRKGNWEMTFNNKIQSPNGFICGIELYPLNEAEAKSNEEIWSYEKAHERLGHPGAKFLEGTIDHLKIPIKDKAAQECKECLLAKARRVNLPKEALNKSERPGERLCIDISSVKGKNSKPIGKFWLLVVDEATSMKWSFFLKQKSDQVEVLRTFILDLKTKHKRIVKHIRCDNAGENYSLQKELDAKGFGIKFEFTARKTPQQNGKVERAFATLYGRMRAMMLSAGFEELRRKELWTEAAATATKIDNILRQKGEPSPHKRFYGYDTLYEEHLRTFGELGVVTDDPGVAIKAKLADRGILCMFLGYAKDHAGDVYRMLNLTTRKVIITRDVRWINKKYHDKKGKVGKVFLQEIDDEEEEREQRVEPALAEQNQPQRDEQTQNEERPQRLPRELRNLQPFNKPGRLEQEQEGEGTLFCFIAPEVQDNDDTPQTFQEAWWHPNEEKRKKWREAIRLEFRQMIKLQVWRRKGLNILLAEEKELE